MNQKTQAEAPEAPPSETPTQEATPVPANPRRRLGAVPATSQQMLLDYQAAKDLPIPPDFQPQHAVACAQLRALAGIAYRMERLERLMEKGLRQTADDNPDASGRPFRLSDKARRNAGGR